MKQLKSFCEKIAFLCRVRYEICNSECPNKEEICEQIDESIQLLFEQLKTEFRLNSENIELFTCFFWDCLKETERWKKCFQEFGKDFNFSEELLIEKIENYVFE